MTGPGLDGIRIGGGVVVAATEEDPDVRARGGGIEHPAEHYDGE
jgi:hypothetical protein